MLASQKLGQKLDTPPLKGPRRSGAGAHAEPRLVQYQPPLERIHGPRQLTDAYLLGMAANHQARFATFDRRISTDAVPHASPENLVIV